MKSENQYSTSPERGSFYRNIWKKQVEEGKTTQELYDVIMKILDDSDEKEKNRNKEFDLEYDLRSNSYILDKARNSMVYSQNLYAALCNNQFLYGDKLWCCSWRHSGGIVADILQKGDYIDWYCSGIGCETSSTPGYVEEGFVTEEIRLDLMKLGWVVKPYDIEENIENHGE